jgi:hypothetical protein
LGGHGVMPQCRNAATLQHRNTAPRSCSPQSTGIRHASRARRAAELLTPLELPALFTPVELLASDAPLAPLALADACYGASRGVMAISIARYIVMGLAVW